MFEFFKKPHPFIFSVYSIVIPSVVTFLILVVFAPFQFQHLEMNVRIISASLISLLVAFSIFITVKGLQQLFPTTMAEDKWNIGKEFLLVLLVLFNITVLILIAFLAIQTSTTPILSMFFKFASITLAVSLLPILVSILFEQYRHQKIQLKKALALTESLKTPHQALHVNHAAQVNTAQTLLIKSENNHIELRLNPQDLIYLKSDGNYIEVYFNNSSKIEKKVIRNRLKTIEHSLPEQLFFRCHNSFIVNGNHIIKVEGNARNLMLHLKEISEQIPVSRTKAKIISSFLENLQ